MMYEEDGITIKIGLRQIDLAGLRRLDEHIKAGKPMLLDGMVYSWIDDNDKTKGKAG
jgi:hypothetical protein